MVLHQQYMFISTAVKKNLFHCLEQTDGSGSFWHSSLFPLLQTQFITCSSFFGLCDSIWTDPVSLEPFSGNQWRTVLGIPVGKLDTAVNSCHLKHMKRYTGVDSCCELDTAHYLFSHHSLVLWLFHCFIPAASVYLKINTQPTGCTQKEKNHQRRI